MARGTSNRPCVAIWDSDLATVLRTPTKRDQCHLCTWWCVW